jgi:hypothetical protein
VCVNNKTGAMRVPTRKAPCNSSERAVVLNQTGASGSAGATGCGWYRCRPSVHV